MNSHGFGRRGLRTATVCLLPSLVLATLAPAAGVKAKPRTLITNVNMFDGKSERLVT